MNEIHAALQALLPPKKKLTPSGWTSFNSPCCHHRGESKDNRRRGGILINPNGGFQYHCFNCQFKAGWSPGHLLSKNTKNLFKWLGLSDTDIDKLSFIALQNKQDQPKNKRIITFDIEERSLPESTMSVMDWINTAYLPDIAVDLGKIIEYILGRGMELEWYNWMWSPAPGYKDRVMIPFYQNGKVVGYTGRKITEGKPKYLTDAQPGYVFNIDHQTYNRKYVIVVEGQFDAIAIDGIAVMHNEPNETQYARINALGKEVIVVPDRDKPGAKMIQAALNNNWSVSLPPWEDHIKDTADAVKHYGRLYTLFTILHYRETNEIKIQLLKKKLEALNG
jgi:hypothetical protein